MIGIQEMGSLFQVVRIANTGFGINMAGNCTVCADEPGDIQYEAAPQVCQTFEIVKGLQSIVSFL